MELYLVIKLLLFNPTEKFHIRTTEQAIIELEQRLPGLDLNNRIMILSNQKKTRCTQMNKQN